VTCGVQLANGVSPGYDFSIHSHFQYIQPDYGILCRCSVWWHQHCTDSIKKIISFY